MKSHLAGLLLIHTLNGQIIWITCSLLFPPHFLLSSKNIFKIQEILLRQISASSIFWQHGDGDHNPARGDGLLQLPGVQLGNPDCKFFSLSLSSLINHRAPLILKAKSSIATDQQNLCLQQCHPLINLTSTL